MSARADNKPVYHVYPANDLQEHEVEDIDDFACACHPTFHVEQKGYVVKHNAFDMREHFERRT